MEISFDEVRKQVLSIPEVKSEYNALEQEFAIAQALIDARSREGMTQAQVAERIGVTQSVIARMESGRNVSIKSIIRYATAIGKSIKVEIFPDEKSIPVPMRGKKLSTV
ncbi:MAG: helix-turn-helix transcriptional regulator [Desulfovibrio sp.]|nr:helix-turn-helix transcriptional regulator [Desulfovibrio sp.]